MKRKNYVILGFVLLASHVTTLAQCPMCRSAVESSMKAGTKSVGMGLNNGIFMLLIAVYAAIFSVGILWYYRYKMASKKGISKTGLHS
jgi:hypothetical protein